MEGGTPLKKSLRTCIPVLNCGSSQFIKHYSANLTSLDKFIESILCQWSQMIKHISIGQMPILVRLGKYTQIFKWCVSFSREWGMGKGAQWVHIFTLCELSSFIFFAVLHWKFLICVANFIPPCKWCRSGQLFLC